MADLSQLQEASRAVRQAPHAVTAWSDVEALAAELDRPDDLVALYGEVLGGQVQPEVAEMIGDRASSFCDEWFGDEPAIIEKLLYRVLELAPGSESALQRLSVIYTTAERWADLLKLYDRALGVAKDRTRRLRVLREAAQLAKDVANQPEKAIGYLQSLLPMVPDDVQVSQSLERLLERHERWPDLIALWEGRLERETKRDRERSRGRIAACWLDNMHDPGRALAAIKPLLAEAEDDTESCALLERVIEAAEGNRPVRDGAIELLRTHYDATARPREVIRVLESVIVRDPLGSRALREEAGARLADLEDVLGAMGHYAALLALIPESTVVEEKLRTLAQRAGQHDLYAEGVVAAARACADPTRRVNLLAEAGRTRLEMLNDLDGAIAILSEAQQVTDADALEQIAVNRKLGELYARTGRQADRLAALERLATVETSGTARSNILGEAAKLAESLGETDRALGLWERRIQADPQDLSGLDARIALLDNQNRWDDLVEALEARAAKHRSAAQKRADLVRVALVHHQERQDLSAAISAWQRVVADAPDDAEAVMSLSELLSQTGRWKEMAELLDGTSERDTRRTVARLVRLGDALRAHLDEPGRALAAYRSAIAVDPRSAEARAGLTALLQIERTRRGASDALAAAFRQNSDATGVLSLLDARLADAPDDRTRFALLCEAASLRLEHDRDQQGALADLTRAFPMSPKDQIVEAQLHELADATGEHHLLAMAYLSAIAELADEPREATRLRLAYADLTARHLNDPVNAAVAYVDVAVADPGNRRVAAAVADLCGAQGRWTDAVGAVVRHAAARERFDDELLEILDRHASERDAYAQLVPALTQALGEHKLVGPVASMFHYRLAQLHRDQRHEPGAAIIELRRALERGGDRYAWLTELVELERGQGTSRPLLDALRRLAEMDVNDLDLLVEAGDTASKLGDRPPAIAILGQVLARAAVAWRGGSSLRSSRPVDAVARWAVDGLVDLHRAGGNPRAAVDTLAEAARLPFDEAGRRQLRMRAAQLAASDLGDRATAIDMYRNVLAAAPRDAEVIERLAELLAMEDRVPEMLGLRKLQLDIESEPARRLQLRLEIANLVGVIEERGGRLQALLANLEDQPGHDASIEAVSQLLSGKGQHGALADLLEKQAQRLEPTEPARAAKLWSQFALTTERDTREPERAIAGHRKVVALAPTADSLRALARLNLERSQPTQAVPWLESLLGTVPAAERMGVVSQLARAHLSAQHPERAISAIESNLSDKEPALDLRVMLAELYRESEQWEPLARHLTRSLPLLRDDQGAREFAREAAAIYLKLGQPAKAIPALETALALDPTDRELRAQLAIGQRVAGKLPEARAVLSELIADFGRRRSPERAVLHVELARVAQAEGNVDEALSELEQASKMDVNNADVLKELAELARKTGQLDKAERTYKGLLLVVRRKPPGDDESAVGQSEVLFELHKLAAQRGDAEQAKEQLESAMDAAVQSDAEVRRLRRSMLAHGAGESLLHVLEQRLKLSPEPASQARLLSDMAEVLDGSLGRAPEALAAMLRAVNIVPSRIDLYERARELAKRDGETRKFVDAVEAIVDRLRRKDDPPLIADLLMLAGDALEHDAGDPRGAAALYRRVEMMGEKLAEAYYAQARIAAAQGNVEEQARTLDKMLELAGPDQQDPSPAQIDALYRLAEIFISTDHRRSQGVELLERAFGAEPRWAQAARSLREAAAADPQDARVMTMYERVARAGGDGEVLLDFLERRAQGPEATTEQIREAVLCANDLGRSDRVQALLERAVGVAREGVDGVGAAPWAVLQLAEARLQQGELRVARDLVYEVASVAESQDVDALAMRVAARALTGGEPRLAADIYEFLRERTPAERAVWQPLMAIYRELRDGDRLASVLSSTLPHLTTAAERNELRLGQARFLIEQLDRPHDALDVLREALAEDPDDREAAQLFEQTLRALGDDDGITEFLLTRFEDAQRRGNRETTVDVALRLGAILEQSESPDTARVYRAALIVAPDDREILRRVVAHLGPSDDPREAAVLMERLLSVETEEHAPQLAWRLASAWEAAGDFRAVQRTLELAYRAAPNDEAVHDRLEKWYRDRTLWAELAELMIRDAERMGTRSALLRLREAANVYGHQLGQPRKAAEVLGIALTRTPGSTELITEQANALAAAGDLDAAQQAIGNAIGDLTGAPRVAMLQLRASFRQQLGDDPAAVEDLEEAYQLDADRIQESLIQALEKMRTHAAGTESVDQERAATLRLSQLHIMHGQTELGRNLLVAWIERQPSDPEPLIMLCEIDESISHWAGVIAGATRLAYVSTGEPQVQAALRAAHAAAQAGRPADALEVLELVHGAQPDALPVRTKLREMYEGAGSFRELAGVLFADAEHGEDPEQRYANYRRAAELYLYQLDDAASAAPAAQRILELRPDDHAALILNVDVLIASGQAEVAGRTLDAAIAAQKKRSPELAILQQRMGRVCLAQSDREGQIAWLKKAFDVDRKNPEVAAELAQLATEAGDYELALKPLRAISLMDNPLPVTRPMALLWEAKIEHARGNHAKAELWAKKALREDPAFGEAQQFLDELGT
ncbi:MAG: tetratricopeptide repeat protein [Kofleriaceae bacterium]